jgi:hypothetical protein
MRQYFRSLVALDRVLFGPANPGDRGEVRQFLTVH